MISSLTEFDELSKSLEKKGFRKVKAPWTFYSDHYNLAVDILPFGEIEEHDTIQFTERNSDLHVLGFKEVLENPEKISIEEKIVAIPPLPGMIILKLVAWSDRPEERENDLNDIILIIDHYFDFDYDNILENHNDTFPEDDFDKLIISAEVLGRKSKVYLDKSSSLSHRILSILENNLTGENQSKIAKKWARIKDKDVEYTMKILKAFQKGIMNK